MSVYLVTRGDFGSEACRCIPPAIFGEDSSINNSATAGCIAESILCDEWYQGIEMAYEHVKPPLYSMNRPKTAGILVTRSS